MNLRILRGNFLGNKITIKKKHKSRLTLWRCPRIDSTIEKLAAFLLKKKITRLFPPMKNVFYEWTKQTPNRLFIIVAS